MLGLEGTLPKSMTNELVQLMKTKFKEKIGNIPIIAQVETSPNNDTATVIPEYCTFAPSGHFTYH